MKALAITKPHGLAFIDVHEPTLKSDELLLKIRRIGYCGSDLNTFRGSNPVVSYPRIPGHEIGAEIISIGGGVPMGFQVGEMVTVFPYTECGACSACRGGRPNCCQFNQTMGVQRDGGLAEKMAVPWTGVVRAPGLKLPELALVEPLAVGFHAVERGRVSASDTVCVLGCGMIGLGAIAGAALKQHARVIGVDVSDDKLTLATKAGANDTVNSVTEDLSDRLLNLTDGHGPTVMIEAVGLPDTFRACIDEACHGGRVVYIGYAKAPVTYDTKHFLLKELDILGSRNATRANFQAVIEILRSGCYPVRETISHTSPFQEAANAMRKWADDPSTVTKIHIDLGSEA